MIPVQKHFPPERLRYMRARMKEHNNLSVWRNKTLTAVKSSKENQRPVKPLVLEKLSRRILSAECNSQPRSPFEKWQLSQQRQSWLYAAIGGAVLCVVIFVVAGGCR